LWRVPASGRDRVLRTGVEARTGAPGIGHPRIGLPSPHTSAHGRKLSNRFHVADCNGPNCGPTSVPRIGTKSFRAEIHPLARIGSPALCQSLYTGSHSQPRRCPLQGRGCFCHLRTTPYTGGIPLVPAASEEAMTAPSNTRLNRDCDRSAVSRDILKDTGKVTRPRGCLGPSARAGQGNSSSVPRWGGTIAREAFALLFDNARTPAMRPLSLSERKLRPGDTSPACSSTMTADEQVEWRAGGAGRAPSSRLR